MKIQNKKYIAPSFRMTNWILSLFILIFILTLIIPASTCAFDDPQGELVISVGTIQAIIPYGGVMVKYNQLGLTGRYAAMPYSWQNYSGRINLWQLSGRVYSPISYRNIDFYLEAGVSRASFEIEEASISAPGYQANIGFEREVYDNFSLGGQLGYLHLPPEELSSQILFGLSVNYSFPLKQLSEETEETASRAADRTADKTDKSPAENERDKIVSAEGDIDGLSGVSYSVSGTWSFSADFAENTATLSVSGTSEGGSFSHSVSGEPQLSGNGVLIDTSMSGSHDDMEVLADIRIRVDPNNLSINIQAEREDGLQMSASASGTTTSYKD